MRAAGTGMTTSGRETTVRHMRAHTARRRKRHARVRQELVLNVLIALCAAGIAAPFVNVRGRPGAIGGAIGIATLFGLLDLLVFARLARPVLRRVRERTD